MKMITATEWDTMETPNILTSMEIGIGILAKRGDADRDWVLGLMKLILDEVLVPKNKQALY